MYARVAEWNSKEFADEYSTMLNNCLAHSVIKKFTDQISYQLSA